MVEVEKVRQRKMGRGKMRQPVASGTMALFASLFFLLQVMLAMAIPVPQGIMGTVYQLDGVTQVPPGTSYSVNNTNSAWYFEGGTGGGYSTGRYAVSLSGEIGDLVVIRVWSGNQMSSRNVTLDGGVLKNVNLLLNATPQNHAPEITSTAITSATEDVQYVYGIVANDEDEDDISYQLLIAPTGMSIDQDGEVTWLPDNADVGNHTVSVLATDGELNDTQSYILSVANVNDAPVIISIPSTSSTEDVQYQYQIVADDDDGDTLSYLIADGPLGMTVNSSTGWVSWTPDNDDVGSHDVVLAVYDGLANDSQSFTLDVVNVNDAPQIISIAPTDAVQDQTYAYQVDALDPDNASLTYTVLEGPGGFTMNASGYISWLPDNGDVGSYNVSIEVSDGIASDAQDYVLIVANVNDAPYITTIPNTQGTQGLAYLYDANATDIDSPPQSLNYSLIESPTSMAIQSATGKITWLPDNDDVGIHNVTILVTDGSLADNQTYALLVLNVNDPPTIISTPLFVTPQDAVYVYVVEGTDIDGDNLSYSLNASPSGMVIDHTSGEIMWTPGNDDVGTHNISVMVTDGNLTDMQNFVLAVMNVNDAPVISSNPPTTVAMGNSYQYVVVATDPDGDNLTYSLPIAPSGMGLSGNTITWGPSAGQLGPHQVKVVVADGNLSAQQTFTVTVQTAGSGGSGGGGGGGGGGGVAFPIQRPRILRHLLKQFLTTGVVRDVNVSVTSSTQVDPDAIVAKVFVARPGRLPWSFDRPVYRYLEISVESFEEGMEVGPVEITFQVAMSWLDIHGADPDEVTLYHYDGSRWDALPTRHDGMVGDEAVFLAESPSLSYFAISLDSLWEPDGQSAPGKIERARPPIESYLISGTILNRDREEVRKGTRFRLENLENGEVREGETGVDDESGRFSARMQAAIGDTIILSVDGREETRFEMTGDMDMMEVISRVAGRPPFIGFFTAIDFGAPATPFLVGLVFTVVMLFALVVMVARRDRGQ